MTGDPFLRLARVGGAAEAEACAQSARALVTERLPAHPFDAAVRVKRLLAARGFRDEPRMTPVLRRSREQRPAHHDENDAPWREPAPRPERR